MLTKEEPNYLLVNYKSEITDFNKLLLKIQTSFKELKAQIDTYYISYKKK